jgi:hypothetical protein
MQARSWFVLCKSANSKSSRWVQSEIEIIEKLTEKTYAEIDLDDPLLDLDASLFSLSHKASVFLSYARNDDAIAQRIKQELKLHDFGVFSDLEIKGDELWKVRIESELENAAMQGAILLLVSAASIRSRWQQAELEFAVRVAAVKHQRAHILPLYLEGFDALREAPPAMRGQINDLRGLDLFLGRYI